MTTNLKSPYSEPPEKKKLEELMRAAVGIALQKMFDKKKAQGVKERINFNEIVLFMAGLGAGIISQHRENKEINEWITDIADTILEEIKEYTTKTKSS